MPSKPAHVECPQCDNGGPHSTWTDEDGSVNAECRGCTAEFQVAPPDSFSAVERLIEYERDGYGEGGRPVGSGYD